MDELIQQTEELVLHAFEIGRTRGFAEGYDAGYKRGIDAQKNSRYLLRATRGGISVDISRLLKTSKRRKERQSRRTECFGTLKRMTVFSNARYRISESAWPEFMGTFELMQQRLINRVGRIEDAIERMDKDYMENHTDSDYWRGVKNTLDVLKYELWKETKDAEF